LFSGCNSCCDAPSSSSRAAPQEDLDWPVADFALTDQEGRPVRQQDLLGKVWVASFIFTRCTTQCPQISGTLARLQRELEEQDDVLLVSFSVDPEHDTRQVLKEYAGHYGADPRRWLLLTGDREQIYRLTRASFKLAVEQNQGTARTPGNEVTHSTKLAVVDRRGRIRSLFDGRQVDDAGGPVDELPQLRARITALLRE
jgi:cytochrome oxidase Cu insertion factor (SCO1/SenC/PrrC family)